MSRPPTMSMLLKRAGLAKRPRPDRATPTPKQQQIKRKRPTGAAQADGSSDDCCSEGKAAAVQGVGSGGAAGGEAVDDQIAALERELQGGSEDSSSSSSSSNDESSSSAGSDDDDERPEEANGATATSSRSRERRRQLPLVSPLEAEKIEPLPAHLLPRPGCGVPKANSKKKKPKKAKRGAKDEGVDAGGAAPAPSGLDSAVKELLANYEARSSERVPFYCRVCQFQGERCVSGGVYRLARHYRCVALDTWSSGRHVGSTSSWNVVASAPRGQLGSYVCTHLRGYYVHMVS